MTDQFLGLMPFFILKGHTIRLGYFLKAFLTELLKAEDVKMHICAKFLRISAKFVLLNAKQEKQELFFMILAPFDKIQK